ncbi:MAG TPA: hypothetical protein DCG63_00475 [Methylophilaceae bacterium]|nr:hypothetical protein [Methylophilaceae bacterium]
MGMMLKRENILPKKLYRGFLMLTCSWQGARVAEGSLLFKVHDVPESQKLPLIWCGGPPEMETIISAFGQERSIYGLRGTYDYAETSDLVIHSLSQYYADEIERAIPSDTYLIAGYCAAAMISMEVATILTKRGYKIGFLGLIDRDVTEKTLPLKIARKFFEHFDDRIGARIHAYFEEFKKQSLKINLVNCFKVLKIRLNDQAPESDPRDLIKYKKEPNEAWYELKPYPGKISLIYIRWAVFGYFQLGFFRNYWRKIALGGFTVDFVPGLSHKYPNWPKIIDMLHRRLVETGY